MQIVSETSKWKQTYQELGSYKTISLQSFAVMSISALIFEKSQAFPVGSSKLNWIQKLRELMCKKWRNFLFFQRSVEPWCGKWLWTKFKEARTVTGHSLQVSCCCDQCLWQGSFQRCVSIQNLSTRLVSCRINNSWLMKGKQRKSLPWKRIGYMILIIIKLGELLLWISRRIIHALRGYKECFIRYPNPSKLVGKKN